jgi:hypothetical protein
MANASSPKNSIGIYISPKEICVAQTRAGAKLEAEHLLRLPTGFQAKTGIQRPLSLNGDFFSEKAAWVNVFQTEMRKVGWNSAAATVSLSPQFAILRYFVMPGVDKRFWNKSIPIESRKYIPVSFDEVVYDFNVCPLEGGKKLGILFGLTQKKSVEFVLNVLRTTQFEVAAVEISPCSMERLFAYLDPQEHQSKAYAHFSGAVSHMLFSSAGLPVLYRETDYETSASSTMTESRRLDVKGAVQFVERYSGGRSYGRLMLSGDGAEVWKQLAVQEAPMPVEVWDPALAAGFKDNSAPVFFAAGASLRGRVEEKLSLDVSGIGASSRLEKQVLAYTWAITAALSGFLLLLSLFAQVRIMLMSSRLADLSSKLSAAAALRSETRDSIVAKIDKMKADAKQLSMLVSKTEFFAPQMQAINDCIPRDLWLTAIHYTSPLATSEMQALAVELRLTGETGLTGETKNRMVEDFKKTLKLSPELKSFSGAYGGWNSNLESESGNQRGTPYGSPSAEIKSTGFMITASVRRKS